MIFGVDGTGAFWNKDYFNEMKDSFVAKICGGVKSPTYWRGPDAIDTFLSGPNPRVVAEAIRMSVDPNAARPQLANYGRGAPVIIYPTSSIELPNLKDKVFLTGYSRGAATVLDVAVILKDYGIPVEAMFLFDSVTRSLWLSANVVPSNVRYCYHLRRDLSCGSRRSFGNSEVVAEDKKRTVFLQSQTFKTTHAGMGGTPWGVKGLLSPARRGNLLQQMGTLNTPTQIAANLVAEYPNKYGNKIFEGAPDWAFTNLTVDEERAGMASVRETMRGYLQKHNLGSPI